MRDMFYNYDYHINKKEYLEPRFYPNNTKILESDPHLQLVLDAMGNEIGVCARHNSEFTLYFVLEGDVEGSTISDLVHSSQVVFDLVDYWHKPVISKVFSASDVYTCDDTICITISRDDAMKLRQETYRMRLSLNWPGGGYELYSEHNGFLTIK